MQAYYNILSTLRTNLQADKFVNTVTQGDLFDVDLDKHTIFPLSHIVVNEVTKQSNILVFNVSVLCMDIVDKSKEEVTDKFVGNDNEQDVINTQMAVALRLVEILERGGNNNTFMMRGEPTFELWTERFQNYLAGVTCTFDIHVPNTMTACDDLVSPSICADATYLVQNSDATTIASGTIASGGSATIALVDIDININGADEGDIPASTDVSVNLSDSSGTVTPDAISVTGSTVNITLPDNQPPFIGADLVKTNQSTPYNLYDDGTYKYGRATDALTIASNNPFGNTNRFTDELGGQTYANNIVIDWTTFDNVNKTVVGFDRTKRGTDTFNNACTNAAALTTGGFSNWRLPNFYQYVGLMLIGFSRAFNWSPLNQGATNDRYWTSSTAENYTDQPIYVGNQFILGSITGTQTYYWIAYRTFTVTGSTLS